MQSSPPNSDGKARAAHAIRQLSRSLSHSPRAIPSPSPPPSDSNPTQQIGDSTSAFFNNDEVLMSTQHNFDDDTNTLPRRPHLRSTAKKYGSWQLPKSEAPGPDTSMVKKHFADFDHSVSDSDDDPSIEQARGGNRSNRSTPGKVNSSMAGFNSLYDMTPPPARLRKSYPAETGSLRRDAQIRRASRNEMETASPRHGSARNSPAVAANNERKRTTLAKSHAKISEDESSFIEERPPTITLQAKTTRFSGPRSRQTSAQMDAVVESPAHVEGTQRSRPTTAQNATAQSFMLPDLPNLTELVSGVFQDGTPVFSKAAPPRSRFAAPHNNGRARGRHPNHIPVDSVPIPEEEKAIFASLQLLKEKVAQLEHERAEAEKKIEEQEIEIIELRASCYTNDKLRRSDSALGSTDGEGPGGKTNWKVEKTRLEASVETLRTRLDRSERKLSVSEIANKRITSERDNLVSQLSVAFQNFEDIKREKEALRVENDTLRNEVDSLRAENDALRGRLEQEQEMYQEETQNLRRQVDRAENVVHKENETLRVELARVRAQYDENTQHLTRKEVELRKARKEQADFAKLKADNEALKAQVASFKARREEEARRWASREAELKGRIDRRDDTIRHFQDMTQEQTNEAVQIDNENLRQELAQLAAQHEDEEARWTRREQQLKKKIQRREGAVREMEDMTREVLSIRQATASVPAENENTFKDTTNIQRKPSHRREDTRTRIANRVQEASRNSRSASAFHSANQIERSPRKSSFHRASLPVDSSRSVSAPVSHSKHAQVDSDMDSTTDLSLAPRGTPYVMRGGASGMPTAPVSIVEPPAPLDLTELSFINSDAIAALRRTLEEERAAARGKSASVPAERHSREDTVRSVASVKSTRQASLPRKSSMKDAAEKNNATCTIFEDLSGHVSNHNGATPAEPTQTNQSAAAADTSILSNTSRRRRSAPAEMTSAFIVPDITIHTRKQCPTTTIDVTQKIDLEAHDDVNCTVCRRNAENPSIEPLRVPKLVPVSSRMPDDIDATLRPARSPKEALALVVKELQDELAHLHLELRTHHAILLAHDPSMGMKNRKTIETAIANLLERISSKSTQIYHLYDVLEGQQGDHEITEQELEEITREIRVEEEQVSKKGKEKKVTIQSYIDSENESEHSHFLSGGEEELPWEGFEDTASQSLNLGKLGVGATGTGIVY